MIRSLILIAAASFVLAVACLGGAAALGARYFMQHHDWAGSDWAGRNWAGHDWGAGWRPGWVWGWRGGRWTGSGDDRAADGGAAVTRQIAWTGGDSLDVDLPADVRFTQAPGPGKLVITGPKGAVDRVELWGPHLRYGDGGFGFDVGRVTVAMTAPDVRRFAISGDGSLSIDGFDQDELDVQVSGDGDVHAAGKAQTARLDISGDGDVDLGGVKTDSAEADISGSGHAAIAPASAADLRISGDGEIDLLTHPAKLTSDVSGSGRIVEGAPTSKPG